MFEHKGIKIEVLESGNFCATIGGVREVASTLPAMKKKIDSVTSFEEFDALVRPRWGDAAFEVVRIKGIQKARGKKSSYNTDEWLAANGKTFRSVIKDTPEARAAMQNLHNVSAANSAEYKEMTNRHTEAYEKAQDLLPEAVTVK